MTFRLLKQRKETRRNEKLYEIFQERDPDGNMRISVEQVEDIYRIYKVDLEEGVVPGIADDDGQVGLEAFINLAKSSKLLDLTTPSFRNVDRDHREQATPKRSGGGRGGRRQEGGSGGPLCCGAGVRAESPAGELDRVEGAFRRIDRNGDGFITWEEFQRNTSNLEDTAAKRIFTICDQNGDGRLTLEEFRSMANKKEDNLME